jgi:hypothetical protein
MSKRNGNHDAITVAELEELFTQWELLLMLDPVRNVL